MSEVTVTDNGSVNVAVHSLGLAADAAKMLNGAWVRIGPSVLYGVFVELGTRAHDIYPRTAKALAFPMKGVPTTLGGTVRASHRRKLPNSGLQFAKHVRHPGTHAQAFMVPALEASRNQITTRMNKAADDAVSGHGDAQTLRSALHASGLIVQADAQKRVAVKTGTLRRSIHTELGG